MLGARAHAKAVRFCVLARRSTRLAPQDEFPLYYGTALHEGYSKGPLFAEEANKKGAGKLNVHAVITHKGWLKVWATEQRTGDDVTHAFMMTHQASPSSLPNLGGAPVPQLITRGDLLFWDRLGRSGRSKNPVSCHFNPAIKKALFDAGVGCDLLPPKGAEVNPCELFNGCVQDYVRHWQPPGHPRDAYGHFVHGPRTQAECFQALNEALEHLKSTPALFRYWYHRRALGSDAFKRWQHHEVAQRVLAARAAAGPAARTYDVAHAFLASYTNRVPDLNAPLPYASASVAPAAGASGAAAA